MHDPMLKVAKWARDRWIAGDRLRAQTVYELCDLGRELTGADAKCEVCGMSFDGDMKGIMRCCHCGRPERIHSLSANTERHAPSGAR